MSKYDTIARVQGGLKRWWCDTLSPALARQQKEKNIKEESQTIVIAHLSLVRVQICADSPCWTGKTMKERIWGTDGSVCGVNGWGRKW